MDSGIANLRATIVDGIVVVSFFLQLGHRALVCRNLHIASLFLLMADLLFDIKMSLSFHNGRKNVDGTLG